MSALKVNQIRGKLLQMFEPHLDLSDVPQHDLEREPKVLSRCLAALAVYLQAGCSEKEAAESVWDGSDDNGIDAAFYDSSESRVLFVQSKWIQKGVGEPEARDVGTFAKGVTDAIEQDATEFHARLQGRFADIGVPLNTPGTRVHLVLVSTGASALARHGQSRLKKLLNGLNGSDPDPFASSEVMGLSEVYGGLTSDASSSRVNLDATILEWSYVAAPFPAYFGIIDGLQLRNWWKVHGKRLVAANIRHALGFTEVNNDIKATATNDPEKFWYFNNGITLIAEDSTKAPAGASAKAAGVFTFKGASIVNGAQTVSSLGRVDGEANLGVVRVPIRVVLLKGAPLDFGSQVARTNNLQNRIEPRDFAAQDPEQRRLRQEMAIEQVDYQFVRSEELASSPSSCELVEVTTALACASGDPGLAVQLKTGIGRFFADLAKPPYKAIFNPSVSGAKAFNAVVMQREIDRWIETKKRSLAKKSGPEWGALVHGNRILSASAFGRYGASVLSQPIASFSTSKLAPPVSTVCDEVLCRMVTTIKKKFPKRFLAVLFKNLSMSKTVFVAAVTGHNR